jgi:hypothetical protein
MAASYWRTALTIFGTPGGTPLNTSPFQGTAPGNPVQAALQVVNPGVGLFPPNSNNNSGDTVMASISRGAAPANVLATNVGTRDSRPGRTLHESMSDANATGTGVGETTVFGGSQNQGPAGGNSLGAGGLNQTNAPGSGVAHILPANAYVATPAIPAAPQFQG